MMFCERSDTAAWLRLLAPDQLHFGFPAARPLALGRLPVPPMQLLYQTTHPVADRRPPRTGLARARLHNPSKKESVSMTQDCTVAPAHLPGNSVPGAPPSGRSHPGQPYAPPAGGWSAETFPARAAVCYRSWTSRVFRPLPCRPMCPANGLHYRTTPGPAGSGRQSR